MIIAKDGPSEHNGKNCRVRFKEVKDTASFEFQEAMKIYVASFPENERRPIASIESTLRGGKGNLIIGQMDDRIVLMSVICPLDGTSFLFGEYLAVAPEFRGRGIGERFIKSIFGLLQDDEFNYILVDIENPYREVDEAKIRRFKFYKRLGFKELKDMWYTMPPIYGTTSAEMILMAYSRKGDDYLDGKLMSDAIRLIFQKLYNRGADDEFLELILKEKVPERVELI